jgi:hypothetical protein
VGDARAALLKDLANDGVGDVRAQALAALVNLTSLDLVGNRIGAEGAQALKGLASLNLLGNRIGAEGVQALKGLVNLTSLNLQSNYIGDISPFVSLRNLRNEGNPPLPPGALDGFGYKKVLHYSAKGDGTHARGHAALEETLLDAVQWMRKNEGVAKIGFGRAAVQFHSAGPRYVCGWSMVDGSGGRSNMHPPTCRRSPLVRSCEPHGLQWSLPCSFRGVPGWNVS